MKQQLTAIPFDGLNTDCLGNYLAALGVIAAVQERWPEIRACWNAQRLVLLAPSEFDRDQLVQHLLTTWNPTPFRRWWDAAFTEDKAAAKKRLVPSALNLLRSSADLAQVRVLDATVVVHQRPITNPLLGPLAGKVSDKRNFESAHVAASQWIGVARTGEISAAGLSNEAMAALKRFRRRSDRIELAAEWLSHTLFGSAARDIPQLAGAGTWFGTGNRSYNNGQAWYREGQLSPWSVIFAMEGVFQLVGGVNRKLGPRSRPYAVFPFLSDPARPESESELGLLREGEFWAPLWTYPASRTEIRVIFQRGLAKLGTRSASAPHEFAVAALGVGVDGGIAEFARFEFRQTTSSQVYEAIPRQRVSVPRTRTHQDNVSSLLLALIESKWIDRLPRDTTRPRRFFGLRGPIEAAIVSIGERPDDGERWQRLLLLLADSQSRIDRNKDLRKHRLPLPPLSPNWFLQAWEMPPAEIIVARAVASVGWCFGKAPIPLLGNVFGVTTTTRRREWRISLPETRTAQAVWGPGAPLQSLLDVAQRRLTDAEGLPRAPFAGTQFCSAALVQRFLSDCGGLDLEEVAKWIPPLSLIDWSNPPRQSAGDDALDELQQLDDGTSMLHALVRPLFHVDREREFELESGTLLVRPDHLQKANILRLLCH